MKKTTLLILGILILSVVAIAEKMTEFPDLFVDAGKLDAIIAVGNKGSASDVISQSNLIQFFGIYTNKEVKNSAKLASEVKDMRQNIILIGNPCSNDLTKKILGFPKPCDDDIQKDRAYIYLYENGKYNYLLVYGYDDKLTRKAVDILINYAPYKLEGTEIIIDSTGKIISMRDKKLVYNEQEEPVEEELVIDEINTSELENDIDEIDSQEFNQTKIIDNIDPEIKVDGKTQKEEMNPEKKDEIIPAEEEGIFSRFWGWLRSLFG